MRLIIGLTGPTGSGKTSVSEAFQKQGFLCIDCDKVAHFVTQNNQLCLNAIKSAFGENTVENGILNRAALAQAAFSSKEKTELLNKTVLPFIVSEILYITENSQSDKLLLDAPTLFESGIDEICNTTLAVLSDVNIRKQRIIKRDNLSEEAAMLRINAGKSDDYYKEKADFVIYNNADKNEFIDSILQIIKNVTKEYDL